MQQVKKSLYKNNNGTDSGSLSERSLEIDDQVKPVTDGKSDKLVMRHKQMMKFDWDSKIALIEEELKETNS